MEIIKKKLDTTKKIYQHIKIYYEKLYPIIEEKFKNEIKVIEEKLNNENLYNLIELNIKKIENEDLINSNISNISIHLNKLLNKNELYDDIFGLYKSMEIYYNNLKFLIQLFNEPKFNTSYMSDISMSETYRLETNDDFEIIKNMYKNYLKHNKENDKKINLFLSKIIIIIFKVKNNILFSSYENMKHENEDDNSNDSNSNDSNSNDNNSNDNDNKTKKLKIKKTKEIIKVISDQDTKHKENYFQLDENLKKSILEIRQYFIKDTNIIDLYVTIIRLIINELYKTIFLNKNFDIKYSCKKSINKIYDYIEKDKLIIFENKNIDEINEDEKKTDNKKEKKKKSQINNPFMNTFAFIPITNLYLLTDLIKLMFKLDKLASKIDLETFSKLHSCCFIVINKIVPNPIEYNIKKLTNQSLLEPITYGITNKFLEKTKTINPLQNDKWNFSYEIYPNSILQENIEELNILKFYVIETLDGKNYRCLSKNIINNSNEKIIYNTNYIDVLNLLNHIKKINIQNNILQPTMINYYQNIHIQKSIPHMFLRKKLSLEPMERESKIDSGLIRNVLFINICKVFDELNYKIKNNDDFNNIIHNEKINDEFVKSIIDMYKTHIKIQTDKFPFSEIFITYLAELKKIASMFIRELHDNYNREPITDFKNSYLIREKFENILKKSLEYIITNKSNIYQMISYKNLLLNF